MWQLGYDVRAIPGELLSKDDSLCVTVHEQVRIDLHVVLREFSWVEAIKMVGVPKDVQHVLVSVAESDDNPEWHAVATGTTCRDASTILKLGSLISHVSSIQIRLESRPAQLLGIKWLEIHGIGAGPKKHRQTHVAPVPTKIAIDQLTSKLIAELTVKSFLLSKQGKIGNAEALTSIINKLEVVGQLILAGNTAAEDDRLRLAAKAQEITATRWFDDQFVIPDKPDNSWLASAFDRKTAMAADDEAMNLLIEENDKLRMMIHDTTKVSKEEVRRTRQESSSEADDRKIDEPPVEVKHVKPLPPWRKKAKPHPPHDDEVKVPRRRSNSPVLRGWSNAWIQGDGSAMGWIDLADPSMPNDAEDVES